MSTSQKELIEAGYPPRPDPVRAAPLYAKWLDIVSTPGTMVESNLEPRTDITLGPETPSISTKWCGLVLEKPNTRYVWSIASFQVPFFGTVPQSKAALWAGLGGFGTPKLIQNGVLFQVTGGVGSYQAWYEYVPAFLTPISLVVRPGDVMDVWAWEGDSACVAGAGHTGFGCFWFQNQTTGASAGTISVAAPPGGTPFGGQTAEAIMERINSAPLSPWFFAGSSFAAVDSNSNFHTYDSDPYRNVTLINAANQTLCWAQRLDATHAMYSWTLGQ